MAGRGSPKELGGLSALSKTDVSALRKLITDCIKETNQPLISQINSLEKSVKDFKIELGDQKLRVDSIKDEIGVITQTTDETRKQVRVQERAICNLAWESSHCALRLQDVLETDGEDLKQTVTRILFELAGVPEEQLKKEIQMIYRQHTHYAKKQGLPSEVHIKFKDKEIRDNILMQANKKPVVYEGKQVRILKDIPFIIRQKRQEFKGFTKQLIDKGIVYRWIFPCGVSFQYKSQRYRIISTEQVERFLEKNGEEFQTATASGPADSAQRETAKEKKKRETRVEKMELRLRK